MALEDNLEPVDPELIKSRREIIAKNEGLRDIFAAIWVTVIGMTDAERNLTKGGYIRLMIAIARALSGDMNEELAAQTAEDDWYHDREVYGPISRDVLFDILYELIETWTEFVDADYYAAFAWTLLDSIAELKAQPVKLRPLRTVRCITQIDNQASMLTNYLSNKRERAQLAIKTQWMDRVPDVQQRMGSRRSGKEVDDNQLLMIATITRNLKQTYEYSDTDSDEDDADGERKSRRRTVGSDEDEDDEGQDGRRHRKQQQGADEDAKYLDRYKNDTMSYKQYFALRKAASKKDSRSAWLIKEYNDLAYDSNNYSSWDLTKSKRGVGTKFSVYMNGNKPQSAGGGGGRGEEEGDFADETTPPKKSSSSMRPSSKERPDSKERPGSKERPSSKGGHFSRGRPKSRGLKANHPSSSESPSLPSQEDVNEVTAELSNEQLAREEAVRCEEVEKEEEKEDPEQLQWRRHLETIAEDFDRQAQEKAAKEQLIKEARDKKRADREERIVEEQKRAHEKEMAEEIKERLNMQQSMQSLFGDGNVNEDRMLVVTPKRQTRAAQMYDPDLEDVSGFRFTSSSNITTTTTTSNASNFPLFSIHTSPIASVASLVATSEQKKQKQHKTLTELTSSSINDSFTDALAAAAVVREETSSLDISQVEEQASVLSTGSGSWTALDAPDIQLTLQQQHQLALDNAQTFFERANFSSLSLPSASSLILGREGDASQVSSPTRGGGKFPHDAYSSFVEDIAQKRGLFQNWSHSRASKKTLLAPVVGSPEKELLASPLGTDVNNNAKPETHKKKLPWEPETRPTRGKLTKSQFSLAHPDVNRTVLSANRKVRMQQLQSLDITDEVEYGTDDEGAILEAHSATRNHHRRQGTTSLQKNKVLEEASTTSLVYSESKHIDTWNESPSVFSSIEGDSNAMPILVRPKTRADTLPLPVSKHTHEFEDAHNVNRQSADKYWVRINGEYLKKLFESEAARRGQKNYLPKANQRQQLRAQRRSLSSLKINDEPPSLVAGAGALSMSMSTLDAFSSVSSSSPTHSHSLCIRSTAPLALADATTGFKAIVERAHTCSLDNNLTEEKRIKLLSAIVSDASMFASGRKAKTLPRSIGDMHLVSGSLTNPCIATATASISSSQGSSTSAGSFTHAISPYPINTRPAPLPWTPNYEKRELHDELTNPVSKWEAQKLLLSISAGTDRAQHVISAKQAASRRASFEEYCFRSATKR